MSKSLSFVLFLVFLLGGMILESIYSELQLVKTNSFYWSLQVLLILITLLFYFNGIKNRQKPRTIKSIFKIIGNVVRLFTSFVLMAIFSFVSVGGITKGFLLFTNSTQESLSFQVSNKTEFGTENQWVNLEVNNCNGGLFDISMRTKDAKLIEANSFIALQVSRGFFGEFYCEEESPKFELTNSDSCE
ncbi:MAG: amino acid transporter [Arenicella sp.]|jgi:amino acid transporter